MLKEGMKRAALVHILKTHEPLRVYKVTLSISDNKGLIEERDLTAKLKLYSMITERLKRPIDMIPVWPAWDGIYQMNIWYKCLSRTDLC